jgi:dephospho-CoA kinase
MSAMGKPLVRIGLTGGIASGKSTVASLFKKRGLKVINLDTVGRNLVEESPSLGVKLSEICGAHVLSGGTLNRQALREHLFSHPESRAAVEALLHPLVWEAFEKEANKAQAAGKKLVVCEAALILEAGLEKHLDELVVVLASAEARLKRVQSRDGIDAGLAAQMIGAQVDDAHRRKAATHVIDNSGDPAALTDQVDALLAGWKKKGYL